MSDAGHMTKRIEETHAGAWHKLAGVSGSISLILPVLSEFEGGENTLMMTQTYTLKFQCEYKLQKYPFDTQVNYRKNCFNPF